MGVGEMGVGEMGVGETGVGEMAPIRQWETHCFGIAECSDIHPDGTASETVCEQQKCGCLRAFFPHLEPDINTCIYFLSPLLSV